ncbi:hypothetical protein [Lacinutrix sp. MEBiC02595]
MENLNELKARIIDVNPDYLELCSDFLMLYSRFEYALKEEGFLQSSSYAMASIDNYVASISEQFNPDTSENLKLAIDFILNDPPRKLIQESGSMTWVVVTKEATIELQLAEYIRRIRNSLLHGAKFYGQIERGSRNWELISRAIVIIEHWIDLNQNVKSRFSLN